MKIKNYIVEDFERVALIDVVFVEEDKYEFFNDHDNQNKIIVGDERREEVNESEYSQFYCDEKSQTNNG